MEKIRFGYGMSMPVRPEFREKSEEFFRDILGCAQTKKTKAYTCFRFPNGQVVGITSDDGAPSEADYEKSMWLEVVSSDFDATKKRILDFGAREVQGGLPGAFFFNAPGGAVFRLVNEEMAENS